MAQIEIMVFLTTPHFEVKPCLSQLYAYLPSYASHVGLSYLLQQAPVEVLRDRTAGLDRMRRATHHDGAPAGGGRTGQSIRAVPLSEQVALVNG